MEERDTQNTEMRRRSAPAHPQAGRRLLSSRQSKNPPKRVVLSRASQSRNCSSRGHYRRSYTSTTKPQAKQPLVSTSIVRTPGYTLMRTPSNVRMDINTSAFFGEEQSEKNIKSSSMLSKPTSKRDSPTASTLMRAAMLEEAMRGKQALEIEVAELTLQIANIKQETEKQAKEKENELLQLSRELSAQYEEEMNELEEKHQQEMCQAQEYYKELVKVMNNEYEEERGQYEEKLVMGEEKLQQSFMDKEEALQKLKEEMEQLQSVEIGCIKNEMQEDLERKMEEVRVDANSQHRQEIEEISAEHEEEIQVLLEKCHETTALKDDLQKCSKKNKKLEKELSRQKEKIHDAKQKQFETEMTLQKTTEQLRELQENLEEKVWLVESKFKDRLDDLMRDNTLLRRRLLYKTDQFCEYKASTEKLQAERIRSTKEKVQIVLRARQKASLSIAMGSHELDTPSCQDRPSSAPTTKSERNNAKLKTDIH